MNVRVVVASAAIHSAVVVVVLLLASTRVRRPPTVDIELVAPALLALQPPPVPPRPPDRGRDAGQRGDRIPERAPARRTDPARRLPRAPRLAPPAPSAAVEPAAPDPAATAPAAPDDAAAGASEPAGGDDLRSGGGTGEGGGGDGGGGGVIDLSSRPVPFETDTARTLPYTAEAQRDRVSGDVHLVLAVDPLGHVGRATVRRGLGHGLDEIATRLALQIRFRPARDRAGKPTAGTVRWRFHFQPP